MLLNPAEDGISYALAQLTSALGFYWTLYAPTGRRVRSVLPPQPPPCARLGRCPLISFEGTCSGSTVADVPGAPPLLLVSCHGLPERAPGPAVAGALAAAFGHQQQARQDGLSTARELAATYQELAIAYDITETISATGSREALAEELLAHVASAAAAEGCCLLGADDTGQLTPLAGHQMAAAELQAVQGRLEGPRFSRPARRGPSGGDAVVVLTVGERQILATEVRDDDRRWGVVAVARHCDHPFSSREAKMLQSTGRQALLVLRNRSLMDDLRGLFISTIEALVAAIEVRDSYTCGHSRRVAGHAQATARRLGLNETEVEAVHMAGIVHDIGKIGLEREVLRKPGRLSEAEWQIVRSHPDHGAAIIQCIPQLRHLVPGIRHHHERRDGGGYPAGLRGDEIPLMSRIIAVADTYDAMTSERSYRPPMAAAAAIRELRDCSGSQFSPEVVAAFIETVTA